MICLLKIIINNIIIQIHILQLFDLLLKEKTPLYFINDF